MPICSITNCDSGSASQVQRDGKSKSYFKARTDEMMRSWSSALKEEFIKGKTFTKNTLVCELHFKEEEIVREFVTKLSDGNISRIPRERPTLKEGAIPSVFSKISTSTIQPTTPENSIANSWKSVQSVCADENEYHVILKNYEKLPLPKNWKLLQIPGYILFLNVASDENCTCKILRINPEMKIEVFLNSKKVDVDYDYIKINEIPAALDFISKLLVCAEGDVPRSDSCLGFVFPKIETMPGRQRKYCTMCSRNRMRILKRNHKRKIKEKKIDILKKKIKSKKHQGKGKIATKEIEFRKRKLKIL